MYYIINKEELQYSKLRVAYVSLRIPYDIQWGPWVLFFIDKDDSIFLTVFSNNIMTTKQQLNDKQLGVFISTKSTNGGFSVEPKDIVSSSFWCEIRDNGTLLDLELSESHEYIKYLKHLVLVPIKELPSILLGTNGFINLIKL